MSLLHQSGVQSANQLGLTWVEFFDDFVGSSLTTAADTGKWFVTTTGTDDTVTLAEVSDVGELLLFGTAADNVSSAQPNGTCASLATGKRLIFEARVKVENVNTDTDQLFGLSTPSVLPLLTTGLPLNESFVGFNKVGASADVDIVTQTVTASSTITTGVGTFAAATYTILRFEWDGISKVRFFQDGAKVGEHTTNLPLATTMLVPVVAHQTIDAGAADFDTSIDYVYMAHER